jgi:hypothetical protein
MSLDGSRASGLTKFDVVAELSTSALQEAMQIYGTDNGKFIRFGSLILLGPNTPVEPDGLAVAHLDIASAAFGHPDDGFSQRVQAAASESDPSMSIGADYRGMLDAGSYSFSLGDDGVAIASITFDRLSASFPRSAELYGRGETGYIAQAALGLDVSVQAGL